MRRDRWTCRWIGMIRLTGAFRSCFSKVLKILTLEFCLQDDRPSKRGKATLTYTLIFTFLEQRWEDNTFREESSFRRTSVRRNELLRLRCELCSQRKRPEILHKVTYKSMSY